VWLEIDWTLENPSGEFYFGFPIGIVPGGLVLKSECQTLVLSPSALFLV